MNLMMLLEMAATGHGERIAFGALGGGLTYTDLFERARAGAEHVRAAGATEVVFLAGNSEVFPLTLFACAWAGVPLVPLNYRLGRNELTILLGDHPDALLVVDPALEGLVDEADRDVRTTEKWLEVTAGAVGTDDQFTDDQFTDHQFTDDQWSMEGDDVALLLYTSGTTARPKAAVVRQRHLVSYVLGTVEFGSAAEGDASLVSVPPYHIAGVANAVTNVYAGRRVVYLDRFTPEDWLQLATAEAVTHALVVPTMLARVVHHLEDHAEAPTPRLRSVAYGGARMPAAVIEEALERFPETDFVNAYGLTETSSTIAVLGPDDHREAVTSTDPRTRARLGAAGRPIPGVEVEIRDADGTPLPPGEAGEIWVRGEQVSGEYAGEPAGLDEAGWFDTNDRGRLDDEGYLFVEGRSDDTIIRGGENVSPAEVEDVLVRHPDVGDVAVVGLPDEEWGERIAAVVVPKPGRTLDDENLREWALERLRSSMAPDYIEVWDELPRTETGKVIRRRILAALAPLD